jgi:hypothetical protein
MKNIANFVPRLFQFVLALNCLAVLYVLGIYSYGGFFSRYMADDYCQAVYLAQSQNIFTAILRAYISWLNSYSILFFTQIIETAGLWGFRLMSGVVILFWVINSTWLIYEIGQSFALKLNAVVCIWFAALGIFISFYQTPVLYQILYWRTGMIPYTLPLVFFVSIAAWILRYARQPYQSGRARRMRIGVVLAIFFVSGLCETTSALLVGILGLAVVIAWWSLAKHLRQDVVILLGIALLTAVVSLLIIALSPGTSSRLDRIMTNSPLYNPVVLGSAVIKFTAQFLWDNLKVTTLPILVAVVIPFAVMYLRVFEAPVHWLPVSNRQILWAVLILLIVMFIAIGFSFAPSAFVRTYPAARARFAAHYVMNFSLILMGGMLGVYAGRIPLPIKFDIRQGAVLFLLSVLCFYPLYVSGKISATFHEYRSFAAAWDERDAQIRQAIAVGTVDLTVKQLDSVGGVVEYKGNPRFWVNVCAARYYGLNSIVAP